MSNMFSIDSWIKYLVLGVIMISLSNIIFGGLTYTILIKPTYWTYITLLTVGGFSSLASGVLMVYDSLKIRLKKDRRKESTGVSEDRMINHIKFLEEEAIRMKPESDKRN